ncbi:hypothetical protein, partial [Thiospirillum jenense]
MKEIVPPQLSPVSLRTETGRGTLIERGQAVTTPTPPPVESSPTALQLTPGMRLEAQVRPLGAGHEALVRLRPADGHGEWSPPMRVQLTASPPPQPIPPLPPLQIAAKGASAHLVQQYAAVGYNSPISQRARPATQRSELNSIPARQSTDQQVNSSDLPELPPIPVRQTQSLPTNQPIDLPELPPIPTRQTQSLPTNQPIESLELPPIPARQPQSLPTNQPIDSLELPPVP